MTTTHDRTSRDWILALDLGTRLGWARTTNDGTIEFGDELLLKRGRAAPGLRELRFRAWLLGQFGARLDQPIPDVDAPATELEADHRPGLVAIERVDQHQARNEKTGERYFLVDAAHVYGALVSTVHQTCALYRVPVFDPNVTELKKSATGKGNASKREMQLAALAILQEASRLRGASGPFTLDGISEDAADAICLLDLARTAFPHVAGAPRKRLVVASELMAAGFAGVSEGGAAELAERKRKRTRRRRGSEQKTRRGS